MFLSFQVRIKCRDYVEQIAIYRDRLAVRLPDKVKTCFCNSTREPVLRTVFSPYCSWRSTPKASPGLELSTLVGARTCTFTAAVACCEQTFPGRSDLLLELSYSKRSTPQAHPAPWALTTSSLSSVLTTPKKKVHVYELTHQEDKYDLRYRLKEKIYLPSKTPPTSSALASSAAQPGNAGESKADSKNDDLQKPGGRPSTIVDATPGSVAGGGGAGPNRGGGFLLVTWNNVILCEGRVLQLYKFTGEKVDELDGCVVPPGSGFLRDGEMVERCFVAPSRPGLARELWVEISTLLAKGGRNRPPRSCSSPTCIGYILRIVLWLQSLSARDNNV